MTFDLALAQFFEDTITIEPFSAESGARAMTFGSAVTYACQIEDGARRLITGPGGRQIVSNTKVTIPDRVAIDQRSRVTLPSGFVPQQPPIIGVEPLKGQGMDHTVVYL